MMRTVACLVAMGSITGCSAAPTGSTWVVPDDAKTVDGRAAPAVQPPPAPSMIPAGGPPETGSEPTPGQASSAVPEQSGPEPSAPAPPPPTPAGEAVP